MDKIEYDARESEYQAALTEAYKALDEKDAARDRIEAGKEELRKARTYRNLRMKQRTFGSTKNEYENVQKAELHRQKLKEHLEAEAKKQERVKIEKAFELKFFGAKGARLEARQASYGPADTEVQNLLQQKEKETRQLEAERQKYIRPDFDRPHAIDLAKGKSTVEYNRDTALEK